MAVEELLQSVVTSNQQTYNDQTCKAESKLDYSFEIQ